MNKMRFSIKKLLLAFTLLSMLIYGLMPPRLSYGEPEFSKWPALYTHWGDIPLTVIAQVPVTNHGVLPVWYRHVSPDNFAAGHLLSTSETLEASGDTLSVQWKSLSRGETVSLREYGVTGSDQIGVQVQDWMGRKFTVICHHTDLETVWRGRETLPDADFD